MDFVVKDKGGDWHYDGNKTYWCLSDGKPVGKIYGEYLPDPVMLHQNKCKAAGIEVNHPDAHLLKTSKVATELWSHWNAQSNK